MRVLHNRTVPPGIYENITITNLREALQGLLLASTLPSRRSKLYRVLFNGQPLWLGANRTTFKTRASAKNAVVNWLVNGLHEVTATAVNSGAWSYWEHIYNRLGLNQGNMTYYQAKGIIEQHVSAMLADGTLRFEAINLDDTPTNSREESIVS
ncbi:hypothetical protein EKK58_00730 [Candidatus Dependentiae bacterium]|nr:MAG: hypothetical protein EKK58_00730 [Candidatus Dependentiae bacterium]